MKGGGGWGNTGGGEILVKGKVQRGRMQYKKSPVKGNVERRNAGSLRKENTMENW